MYFIIFDRFFLISDLLFQRNFLNNILYLVKIVSMHSISLPVCLRNEVNKLKIVPKLNISFHRRKLLHYTVYKTFLTAR